MLISTARDILRIPIDDIRQTIELARLENQKVGAALDRLARELGFLRPRGYRDGRRILVTERDYWYAPTCSYRHGAGERKKQAREKVSSERRREIARQGALARRGTSMDKINVQIIPCPSDLPTWAKRVDRVSADGEKFTCARFDVSTNNEDEINAASELLDRVNKPDYKVQLNIPLEERGVGLSNTGHATIVCGLDGQPLVSVGGLPKCGAAHARFFVHVALVVKYSQHRGQGSGLIYFVGIDRDARHRLGVVKKKLWEFNDENSEEFVACTRDGGTMTIEPPIAAVAAAKRKARDYHCRSAYYANGNSAHGSSGPRTGVGAVLGTSRVGIGY